jgi:hypothetical protein
LLTTKRRKKWWQKPIRQGRITRLHVFVSTMAIMVLMEILSSPVARIWFGLLIVGSSLVAMFLHFREK